MKMRNATKRPGDRDLRVPAFIDAELEVELNAIRCLLAHPNMIPNNKAQDLRIAMGNAPAARQPYQVHRIVLADERGFVDPGHPHVNFALALYKKLLQKKAKILN